MKNDQRIRIRPINMDDTNNIIKWRNNPRIRENFIFQEELKVCDHMNWIETQVNTGKCAQFIIEEIATEMPIGTIYLRDISPVHKKAEYGIYIGVEEALGKGYAQEATELILEFGFNQLNLNKIFLRVLSKNSNAIKSYVKCGFTQDGYFKDDVLINGSFNDVIFMSILKNDYNK